MKKKLFHKITALTLTRRIIQVLSLVLFPGLFISTFSAIKSIYTALIGGTFSAAALTGQIILAVSMLLITAIMGRFFCGFLCAFGTLGDFFWYLGSKLKVQRPKIGTRSDRFLKKLKYVLLVIIVVFFWTFGVSAIEGTSNPWTVFGMLTNLSGWTSLSVILSIGMILLLLIMIGSMFIERLFCRYLCPLGAVFAIVSRFRLFKIRKPRRNCGTCRACTKRCSMGIPLYRVDVVKSTECIDCMNCVEICPRDNATANPKPAFAAAVAVASMAGMYYVGNIAGNAVAEQQYAMVAASVSSINSANVGPFIDGTYSGNAKGYHGKTSVSVTVAGGYITQITVVSTGDDMEFFNQAKASVIPAIISSQSVAVDTVSGATFSSNGIIGAVKNALSNALNTSSDVNVVEQDQSAITPTPVLTPTPTPTPSPTPTATPEATATPEQTNDGPISLSDGTYSGSGTGFRGTIKVDVTVANGYITTIKIVSYRDDEKYFSRAKSKMIDRVIAAQNTDVDTVSGATYSSRGILDAIEDALGDNYLAVTNSVASVTGATSTGSSTTGSGSGTVVSVTGATSAGGGSSSSSGSTQTVSYSYEDDDDHESEDD